VRRVYDLATFVYRFSLNLGASTCWNPEDLCQSRTGIGFPSFLLPGDLGEEGVEREVKGKTFVIDRDSI
jgi:hypothetical protein